MNISTCACLVVNPRIFPLPRTCLRHNEYINIMLIIQGGIVAIYVGIELLRNEVGSVHGEPQGNGGKAEGRSIYPNACS